jgi:hypothetical protein
MITLQALREKYQAFYEATRTHFEWQLLAQGFADDELLDAVVNSIIIDTANACASSMLDQITERARAAYADCPEAIAILLGPAGSTRGNESHEAFVARASRQKIQHRAFVERQVASYLQRMSVDDIVITRRETG